LRDDQVFAAEKWWGEFFYPAFRSRRSHSSLAPDEMPYDDRVDISSRDDSLSPPPAHIEKSSARLVNRFSR
jgi:hypothetical protein